MCNINLIFKKDKVASSELVEYMNYASYNSFNKNNDGDGYFGINKKLSHKTSKDKMLLKGKYWFLTTHQRWATSGKQNEFIHPFVTKDFVLVHNGVFAGLGTSSKSDTSYFVDILSKAYKKSKGDMVEAIKESTKQVNGTFSIVVYDKHTKKAYYFKENCTNMFILDNKKYVIMSTIEENLEYAKHILKTGKKEIMTLVANNIYDIFNNFESVDIFETKPLAPVKNFNIFKKKDKLFGDYLSESNMLKETYDVKKDRRFKVPNEFKATTDEENELMLEALDMDERFAYGDHRNDEDALLDENENLRFM